MFGGQRKAVIKSPGGLTTGSGEVRLMHPGVNPFGLPRVDFKSPPKVAITCDEIDRLTICGRTLRFG